MNSLSNSASFNAQMQAQIIRPETALDAVLRDLDELCVKAAANVGRAHSVVRRAFGEPPHGETNAKPAAVPCGAIASLNEKLSSLHAILDEGAAHLARIETIL